MSPSEQNGVRKMLSYDLYNLHHCLFSPHMVNVYKSWRFCMWQSIDCRSCWSKVNIFWNNLTSLWGINYPNRSTTIFKRISLFLFFMTSQHTLQHMGVSQTCWHIISISNILGVSFTHKVLWDHYEYQYE